MASKSKRRRRVLRASCILAALIIAGSSFAWFTSKDEVTNRLSANADYDVKIVESFAPPENWLPGQEINKDVYAVNTGNVEAFVEESVSGVLTITREVSGKEATTENVTADAVKLTKAEVYAIEDGSYLAWAPTASNFSDKLGNQVVAMIPDSDDLDGYSSITYTVTEGGETKTLTKDFGPDAAGLYVFRRSIKIDENTKVETFKYDAYFFDGKDFYKVTDLSVTPKQLEYAGDGKPVEGDGILTDAKAKFVEEETKVIDPTDLTYEEKDATHPQRLVATYDTGASVKNEDLEKVAKDYDDALIKYNDAVAEYQAALTDDKTADAALVTANKELQEALDAVRDAQNKLNAAEKALQAAKDKKAATDAAKTAADKAAEAAKNADNAADTALGKDTDAASNDADASAWAKYNYAKNALGKDTDAASNDADASAWAKYNYAKNALGKENDAASNDANASAWAKANYAKDNLGEDGITAYYNYLKSKIATIASYTDEQVKTWIENTATYDDINGLDIDNTKVGYNYHQLLVKVKEAQRAVDEAKTALDNAQKAYDKADQALKDAKTKKEETAAAKTAADAAAAAAKDADDKAGAELGTDSDTDTTNQVSPGTTTELTAYAAVEKAKKELKTAEDALGKTDDGTDKDTAYGKYNKAVSEATSGTPSASKNLEAAEKNLAETTQKLAEAKEAYEKAMNSADKGVLKININLSDDVVLDNGTKGKWLHLPKAVNDGVANFYYTSILGAGKTTSKLIDSVELDDSVTQDMFKRFDFDLNVELNSAQITKDADGNITTEAAATVFDKANATVVTPSSVDSVVNWTLK